MLSVEEILTKIFSQGEADRPRLAQPHCFSRWHCAYVLVYRSREYKIDFVDGKGLTCLSLEVDVHQGRPQDVVRYFTSMKQCICWYCRDKRKRVHYADCRFGVLLLECEKKDIGQYLRYILGAFLENARVVEFVNITCHGRGCGIHVNDIMVELVSISSAFWLWPKCRFFISSLASTRVNDEASIM